MEIPIKAKLIERVSKAGNKYIVLELTFSNGYTKDVFLDKSEIYMLSAK